MATGRGVDTHRPLWYDDRGRQFRPRASFFVANVAAVSSSGLSTNNHDALDIAALCSGGRHSQ